MNKHINTLFTTSVCSTLFLSTNIQAADDLQTRTQSTVLAVCQDLGRNRDSQSNIQTDLFQVCGSMVQNSNSNNGAEAGPLSRGLNDEELSAGYQNMVSEETLAPGRIATNASSGQLTTISSRLASLRAGSAGLAMVPTEFLGDTAITGGAAGTEGLNISPRLSGFINGKGGFGEIDPSSSSDEDSADFDHKGVVAGIDISVTDNFVLGVAGNFSNLDLDFSNTANISNIGTAQDVAGGEIESDTYGATLYGSYYLDNFYVDGIFGYSWSDYDISRRIVIDSRNSSDNLNAGVIDRTAKASTDGSQRTLSLQAGYNFQKGSLSFGPFVKLTHLRVDIDKYTESGAESLDLVVNGQKIESLQSVLGGQISYALSQSFGVLTPFFRFQWNHEFKDHSRILRARFVNEGDNFRNTNDSRGFLTAQSNNPDQDYFSLSTGTSVVLPSGLQAFINYKTILGHSYIESHLFTAGVRMEF